MPVHKRGNAWHYAFMIDGVRYRAAIPSARTKSQAMQAEVRARLEVIDGTRQVERKILFSEFVEETFLPWSRDNKASWNDDRLIAKVLTNFFSGRTLNEITPMLVEKFKKERRETATYRRQQRKPATVNRELGVLSKILSLAIDSGFLRNNPCSRVRRLRQDSLRTRYLSDDEENRLIEAVQKLPPLDSIVLIALNTGMRRGEILSLRWEDVDFFRGLINIPRSKSGRPRAIPINRELADELDRLKADRDLNPFVFPGDRRGNHLGWLTRKWSHAVREAGIPNFRFHDLRHTFATRVAAGNTDPFTLASILGHSTIQMSARYAHGTEEGARRAVESLAKVKKFCHKFATKEKRQIG